MDQSLTAKARKQTRSWIRRNTIRIQIFLTFLLLALATIAAVMFSLYLVKKSFKDSYYAGLEQRLDVASSLLTTTAGEIALQNVPAAERPPFSPYVLNVSAVDVANPRKAFDVASQTGCLVTFASRAEMCAALGNQADVGAYLYVVGWIERSGLTEHAPGSSIASADHLHLRMKVRGSEKQWMVVFQAAPRAPPSSSKTDLYATGYKIDSSGALLDKGRDEKEFKGRINIASPSRCGTSPCEKRWYFAFRVPIEEFRADSLDPNGAWPPPDFLSMAVQLKWWGPATAEGDNLPIIDTASPDAKKKYSLDAEIGPRFNALEKLAIYKAGSTDDLLWESSFTPPRPPRSASARLAYSALASIPGRLEPGIEGYRRSIQGKLGSYMLVVQPSEALAYDFVVPAASQAMKALGGTLFIIVLSWIVVEWRVVRRIRLLTNRAAGLSKKLKHEGDQLRSDFGELQGRDELGVLAKAIHELLNRVNDDMRDRKARLERLQSLWSAIGHDIMSPLQSLSSLHPEGAENDRSRPYIAQMEEVVRTLSSAGSLEAANWEASIDNLDINQFLVELSANAASAKSLELDYQRLPEAVFVKADDTYLDMALGHVLDNSRRYRPAGTKLKVRLEVESRTMALIRIHNEGPHIPAELIGTIFDLGVSERKERKDLFEFHRGQGLFISRQLMTSMGGSIDVANCQPRGVEFLIRLSIS